MLDSITPKTLQPDDVNKIVSRILKNNEPDSQPNKPIVMAGPCSVESEEQIMATASAVKKSGALLLRGGAFKPRTSPHSFQGMGIRGLELLRAAGDRYSLPIVTEVMSEDDIGLVSEYADLIQVGARNMQNFALLKKLGKLEKPILLKRGPAATLSEWLSAADYILVGGNRQVILCERGIRGFDPNLRNTLDLAGVAWIKANSNYGVIVDPSHATGIRNLVIPTARAGLAVGADGLIVEVHPTPELALSDAKQQLDFNMFDEMMWSLEQPIYGKPISATQSPRAHPRN